MDSPGRLVSTQSLFMSWGLPDSCLYLPRLTDACCQSVRAGPQYASVSHQIFVKKFIFFKFFIFSHLLNTLNEMRKLLVQVAAKSNVENTSLKKRQLFC